MFANSAAQRAPINEASAAQTDTRYGLVALLKTFGKSNRKEAEKANDITARPGIFGVALKISINYANVAISLFRDDGSSYTYGYIPIVVAKCGVYLKEKATEIEGIFRLAGAERRIKELMTAFSTPEIYGKQLDWTGYTCHDAANLLRRYLNLLPEPVIPQETYYKFREPLVGYQAAAVGEKELQKPAKPGFDLPLTISTYQRLITQLPPLNRQLLLYLLDLLAVFASKSDINMMDASNLSVIFQPGLLRHPDTDLIPEEYRLSQDVLIFLIANQDHFLFGMEGTAADEKTIEEVESAGKTPPIPSTPKSKSIFRSNSTASAASENRKVFGGLRRNASTNSRGSKVTQSPALPGDATALIKAGGIQRSNTVPSKKSSPVLPDVAPAGRFSPFSGVETPTKVIATTTTETAAAPSPLSSSVNMPSKDQVTVIEPKTVETAVKPTASPSRSPLLYPFAGQPGSRSASRDRQMLSAETTAVEVPSTTGRISPIGITAREQRSFPNFFKQSSASDNESRTGRKPNKLQKKRRTEDNNNHSSSTKSNLESSHPALPTADQALSSSAILPNSAREGAAGVDVQVERSNSAVTSKGEEQGNAGEATPTQTHSGKATLFRRLSDAISHTSRSTGNSSQESGEEGSGGRRSKKEKTHRWRLSMPSPRRAEATLATSTGDKSTSSIAIQGKNATRKSFTDDSARVSSASEAEERATSPRRNPVKWLKGKMHKARASSPPEPTGN